VELHDIFVTEGVHLPVSVISSTAKPWRLSYDDALKLVLALSNEMINTSRRKA
jgi:hypothetical protein